MRKFAFLFVLLYALLICEACFKDADINTNEPDIDIPPLVENYQMVNEKNFGSEHDEFGEKIVRIDEKEVFLIGTTFENGNGNSDILLIRLDENEEQVWKKTYGSLKHDRNIDLVRTNDGQFMIIANSYKEGSGVLFIKVNKDGDILLQKTVSGGSEHVIRTKDGGYAFLHYVDSPDPLIDYIEYYSEVIIVKLNPSLEKQWEKSIGSINILAQDISFIQDSNNDYVMTTSLKNEDEDKEFSILKFDAGGDLISFNKIDDYRWHSYVSLMEVSNDKYLIQATTHDQGDRFLQTNLIDGDGNSLWEELIQGRFYGTNLVRLGEDFIICGNKYASQSSPPEGFLVKVNVEDEMVEIEVDQELRGAYLNDVQGNEDGSLQVIGSAKEFGFGYYDVYLLKIEP